MKSDKMAIKPRELFCRIMAEYDSLREFQRQHPETVSLSTLSNWVKERPPEEAWQALTSRVALVAEALKCDIEDISERPRPKPARLDSRYVLSAVLGGHVARTVELDVRGEELTLSQGTGKTQSQRNNVLRGNVLTLGSNNLTGHLRLYSPLPLDEEGECGLTPEEVMIQAHWDGDTIRGAWVERDRKGNILTAQFEGVRRESSSRQARRALL